MRIGSNFGPKGFLGTRAISNFGPVHGIENRGGAENRKGNDWNGGHEV